MKVHTLNTSKTRLSLRLQTLIVGFWSKLKLGCITFACLIPIARPIFFEKKCHVQDCLFYNENFHYIDIYVALCGHCYHPWYLFKLCASSMKCKPNGWYEKFDPSWQLSFGFFNIQDEKKSPLQLEATLMGFLVTNPWPCFMSIVFCCICEIVLDNHMLCTSTKSKLNLCSKCSMKSFWCEEVVATFLSFL